MPVKDGPACPECGLPNYEGLCPHCRGDQDAYEAELVPPFESSLSDRERENERRLEEAHRLEEERRGF